MPTWNKFQQILLDGRSVGVHVAVTADRSQAVPNAIASNFQRKVVLRLTDEDAYLMMGLPKDVLTPTSLPGRAMQVGRPDLMQLAILGDNINALAQARLMEQLGAFMTEQGRARPPQIGALPTEIPALTFPTTVEQTPVIGMEAESLAPLTFRPIGTLSIGGGPQTGRSNALAWILSSLRMTYRTATFLHASSGRSILGQGPLWRASAQGVDAVANMLMEHMNLFDAPAPLKGPGVVLVVENMGDFVYTAAEQSILDAIAKAKANGHLVIAEADLAGWARGGQISMALRASRSGLILCPSLGDSETVLGVSTPALQGREMLPGRGYFAQSGKEWKVQIPLV